MKLLFVNQVVIQQMIINFLLKTEERKDSMHNKYFPKKTFYKMRGFLLFVSLLIPVATFSQIDSDQFDKKHAQQNGIKVKTQYDYSYKGGMPSESGYMSSKITYDEEGNVTEEINYRSSGEVMTITDYHYDGEGNRTGYDKYDGSRDRLQYKKSIIFDGKGSKLMETGFNGADHFKTIYKYNGEGELHEIHYVLNKNLDEIRKIKRNGNLTKIEVYDENDNFLYHLYNRYNDNGKLIEEVKNESNEESKKIEYDYNSADLLNEETKYLYGDFSYRHILEYDSDGYLMHLYEEKPEKSRYLLKTYSYTPDGLLLEEKWRSGPDKDYSSKQYHYTDGKLEKVECYFSTYKFRVQYKFEYQYF